MRKPGIDFPPAYGGVNRHIGEIYDTRGQRAEAASALNVETAPGELGRRRAIVSFATAAPLLRPLSASLLYDPQANSTVIGKATIEGDLPWRTFNVGSTSEIPEEFAGFWLGPVNFSGTPTEHQKVGVEYWNGSTWVAFPWVLDTTQDVVNSRVIPLAKEGGIFWHLSDAEGWTAHDIGGVTTFWVRVSFQSLVSGATATPQGTRALARGVRLADLPPVNGLYEGAPDNSDALLICADRVGRRGVEAGANIGIQDDSGSTRPLLFEIDRFAGWMGEPTMPAWSAGGGAASTFVGNSGFLKKMQETLINPENGQEVAFTWRTGQWEGGVLVFNGTPLSQTLDSVTGLAGADVDNAYEHCRVRVNTPAALGDRLAEVRNSSGNVLYTWPSWGALATSDTFDLLKPPLLALVDGDLYEIRRSNGQQLELVDGGTYGFALGYGGIDDTWLGTFAIVQEVRWMLRRGQRWTFAHNAVTRRALMANGGDIVETDGRAIRKLTAESDSDLANAFAGEVPQGTSASLVEGPDVSTSIFRSEPPRASFVATYKSRTFAAYEDRVSWTFANVGTDIWPWAFQLSVRASEKANITGLYVVNDRLMASTRQGLYELLESAENSFSAEPISQVGLVHQNATCTIALSGVSMLAGVSPDGIVTWDGSGVQMVVSDWTVLLDEPVNRSALHRASAAYVPSTQQAMFAVPVGDDAYPTRILVWEVDRGRWWVWSTPYGVSELATATGPDGGTELLLGYADGFVAVIRDYERDDGQPVLGEIKTAPIVMPEGRRAALLEVQAHLGVLGAQSVSIEVFGDEDPKPVKSIGSARSISGGFTFGESESVFSALSKPLSGGEFRSTRHRARGDRVYHSFQAKVSGTARWLLRGVKGHFYIKSPRGRR